MTQECFFSTSLVSSCLALSECTAHLPVSVMGLGPPADPPPCCHVAHEDSSHGDHTAAEGEVSGMSQTGGSWGGGKKAGFLTLTHTSRRRREIMLGIQNPHLSPDNTATHSRRSHSSHGGALFSLFQVTCNVPKMRQAC